MKAITDTKKAIVTYESTSDKMVGLEQLKELIKNINDSMYLDRSIIKKREK